MKLEERVHKIAKQKQQLPKGARADTRTTLEMRQVSVTSRPGNINSRLKGAVDRELGGNIYGVFPQFSEILDFDECCAKNMCLVRFLRIGPVQSVVNSPTQLSGRGFPHICYMKLVLSQHYVFLVLQTGSRAV